MTNGLDLHLEYNENVLDHDFHQSNDKGFYFYR